MLASHRHAHHAAHKPPLCSRCRVQLLTGSNDKRGQAQSGQSIALLLSQSKRKVNPKALQARCSPSLFRSPLVNCGERKRGNKAMVKSPEDIKAFH